MKFKFENLDSIRAIAFISKFLSHAFYSKSIVFRESSMFKEVILFSKVFGFGVPIFFVLSGFLISYLMLKEQEGRLKFNILNFYTRRALRIWPVYFMVLFIGFVLFPFLRNHIIHQPYIETANPLYYIFFMSNFHQIKTHVLPYGIGLGPTWSLGVEEQFYLFWPILFLLFKKKKFIIAIFITLIVSIIASSICNLPAKHTLHCMIYLSVGSGYAYFSFYKFDSIKRIVQLSSFNFFMILIILILSMYIYSSGHSSIVLIVFIAFIIGYIIVFQCFSGRMAFKHIPFIDSIGKYTYGLYLYHVICNFIIHILIDDVLKWQENMFVIFMLRPFLSLLLSLVVSYLSYQYIEAYFLKLKDKFSF